MVKGTMTLFGIAMGMMGSSTVRAATFLSKSTGRGAAAPGSMFAEASRRRIFLSEDETISSAASINIKSPKRESKAVAVVDDLRVSDSIIMGTIPMRQFQYRSFWSWRGGEAEDDESDTSNTKTKSTVKEPTTSSKSSSFKKSEKYGNQRYKVSYSTEQGFRSYMEDEFFIAKNGEFCCCFDGHGGAAVSRYLRKNLYANVQAFLPAPNSINSKRSDQTDGKNDDKPRYTGPTVEDYANALQSALDKIDKEILRISHWSFQGSTAVVIWVHEEKMSNDVASKAALNRTIIAANIGDSRAVLCRDNQAWNLTRDHKPNDPDELQRIESLGGSVIWCGDVDLNGRPIDDHGIYRVNGNLALSRAIGDRAERPHVTAEPEIIAVPVEAGDEFIVIATDGLWDVMDSDEAVNYVKFALDAGLKKESVAHQMVQEALRRGTFDNITVVIVWL
jgi:protein phosphatase 1L